MASTTSTFPLTILGRTASSNDNITPSASPSSRHVKAMSHCGQLSRHTFSGPIEQPFKNRQAIPPTTWLTASSPFSHSTLLLQPSSSPTWPHPSPWQNSSPSTPTNSRSAKTTSLTSRTTFSQPASPQFDSLSDNLRTPYKPFHSNQATSYLYTTQLWRRIVTASRGHCSK
jgi:hypothetical protein